MTRYALRFRDGTISVRRVADDEEIARFQARGDREIWVFGFSPDGRYLATTHFPGGALTVWDIERRTVAVEDPGPHLVAARFSPDSRRIAVAHEDGELLVYDLATGRPSRPWPGQGESTWPSVPTGPRSRSSTMRRTPPPAGFSRRSPAGSSGRFPLRADRG